jgi:hypothetical protein
LIEFLTGDSEAASWLRRHNVIKIVPMLNPDGVIEGNYRTSLEGIDMNRTWASPSSSRNPTIFWTKVRHFPILSSYLSLDVSSSTTPSYITCQFVLTCPEINLDVGIVATIGIIL